MLKRFKNGDLKKKKYRTFWYNVITARKYFREVDKKKIRTHKNMFLFEITDTDQLSDDRYLYVDTLA